MSEQKVTMEMSVEEIVERYPAAVRFLMEQGIVCVVCGEPVWGTLGETIERKGKDPEALVKQLNEFLDSPNGR